MSPLGTAYIAVRGYAAPQVGPTFHRARQLCERIGGPQEQFAVVWGNFAWRIVRGEMDLSLDLAGEAIDHAKKLDDPGVWMEALFLMGVTLYYRGDFAGARQQYETALARYDDDRERTRMWAVRVGEHAGVTHRCYLALALWHLGYAEEALKVNREMLELARSIDHPFSLAYALHHTSWLYQFFAPAEGGACDLPRTDQFRRGPGVPAVPCDGDRLRGWRLAAARTGPCRRSQASSGYRRLSRHRRRARAPLILGFSAAPLINSGRPAAPIG